MEWGSLVLALKNEIDEIDQLGFQTWRTVTVLRTELKAAEREWRIFTSCTGTLNIHTPNSEQILFSQHKQTLNSKKP